MSQQVTLRYRPRTWGQVLGQPSAVTVLRNSVLRNDIKACYLFSGPRGTGKTSVARIFSKFLNCGSQVKDVDPEPCCMCPSCRDIDEGRSRDVLEFDAAAGRSVDYVDQLRSLALQVPEGGRCRIFILDEVHMLSTTAQNSLLKLLEEPPDKVVFVLVTTESHKVLQTVRSRCLSIPFVPLPADAIRLCVSQILSDSKVEYEDSVVDRLVSNSDGSLRDLQQQVDQLLQVSGVISESTLETVLGVLSKETNATLLSALISQSAHVWATTVGGLVEKGVPVTNLVFNIERLIRDWIMVSEGANVVLLSGLDRSLFSIILSREGYLDLFESLALLRRELQFSPSPRLCVDLFYLRALSKRPVSTVLPSSMSEVPPRVVEQASSIQDILIGQLSQDPVIALVLRRTGCTIVSAERAA